MADRRARRCSVAGGWAVLAGVLCVATTCSAALGQCAQPQWLPGSPVAGLGAESVGGQVADAMEWDTDGPGPMAPWLVIAGYVDASGPQALGPIAAFDGAAWRVLASRVQNSSGDRGSVRALGTFRNELYAAGDFDSIDGVPARGVARFDGERWHALGEGLRGTPHRLFEHEGRLLVAGTLVEAGGVPVTHVAAWDGDGWRAMGNAPGSVHNLIVFNSDLYALGEFAEPTWTLPPRRLARWDGVAWEVIEGWLGQAGPGRGSAAVFEGRLVTTGSGITASWDGATWRVLGEKASGGHDALAVFGGALYRVGQQASIVEVPLTAGTAIERWEGKRWRTIGVARDHFGQSVRLLTPTARGLLATGSWAEVDGVPAQNAALFDGVAWRALTPGGAGRGDGLLVHGGEVWAYGRGLSQHGLGATRVARWRGRSWEPMPAPPLAIIYDMVSRNGRLLAGGLSRRDGPLWWSRAYEFVGGAWTPLGTELLGSMFALEVHAGRVVAGGIFRVDQSVLTHSLWAWTGSAWTPAVRDGTPPSQVLDLLVDGTTLYSGGMWGTRVVRVDSAGRGTSLNYPRDGADVTALVMHDGRLHVGQRSGHAGSVARLDGTTWTFLDTDQYGSVNALASWRGRLVAAGLFRTLSVPWSTTWLRAWDGAAWTDLAPGFTGTPLDALGVGDDLFVAGQFSRIGGVVSHALARYGCPRCEADVTGDGEVTIDDVQAFVTLFAAGDLRVDFTPDAELTFSDVESFLRAYNAGC